MGTNYYWHHDICGSCGRSDDPIHIGKSSAGWCFALHVDEDIGIKSLDDWMSRWGEMNHTNSEIRDEYGHPVSRKDKGEVSL